MPKRIAGVFLPNFLLEFAVAGDSAICGKPMAVVVSEDPASDEFQFDGPLGGLSSDCNPQSRLAAVSECARNLGVHVGQSWVQALSRAPNLLSCTVNKHQLVRALAELAETLSAYGSPVSFQEPDTLWVDISGAQNIFEDELALAVQVSMHLKKHGHVSAVAIAPGRLFSQAAARYLAKVECPVCIPEARAPAVAAQLPVQALPVSPEICRWFEKLGLEQVGQVRELPESFLVARLEALNIRAHRSNQAPIGGSERPGLKFVATMLDFMWGRDCTEICPHQAKGELYAETLWDDAAHSVEPILFCLKGLCAKFISGARARGESVLSLKLSVFLDHAALVESRAVESDTLKGAFSGLLVRQGKTCSLDFEFNLACSVAHADELERIISARLWRASLPAPAVGIALRAKELVAARSNQFSLSQVLGVRNAEGDLRRLAVLVSELQADVGPNSVGWLSLESSALWEKASGFKNFIEIAEQPHRSKSGRSPVVTPDFPLFSGSGSSPGEADSFSKYESCASRYDAVPSRFWSLGAVGQEPPRVGLRLKLRKQNFFVKTLSFFRRDEGGEWWRGALRSKDYFRAWLELIEGEAVRSMAKRRPKSSGFEVLLCFDRVKGKLSVCASFD